MARNDNTQAIRQFLGLRNVVRPERQPLGALAEADNVFLDDTGTVERRFGYAQSLPLSGVTDAYGHKSFRYAIVVANGSIYRVDDALGQTLLGTGYTDGVYQWAQVEDRIFFAGATEAGMILRGQSLLPLRWPDTPPPVVTEVNGGLSAGQYQFAQVYRHAETGMEGPASTPFAVDVGEDCAFLIQSDPPTGYEADIYVTAADDTTFRFLASGESVFYNVAATQLGAALDPEQLNASPLPTAPINAIEIHESSLYIAIYDQSANTSFIWPSAPYWYQLVNPDDDGLAINGKVLGMLSTPQGLLIGSDVGIWIRTPDDGMVRLADYGVVPGRPFARNAEGDIAVWTKRGLATVTAEGFRNRFEGKLSVAPGSSCSVALVDFDGSKQSIVLTDSGGTAFNPY
jgi:hypothetical protein